MYTYIINYSWRWGLCSYLRIFHNACHIRLDAVCNAKVNQFQRGIHNHKIGWLQVTMDNTYTKKKLQKKVKRLVVETAMLGYEELRKHKGY